MCRVQFKNNKFWYWLTNSSHFIIISVQKYNFFFEHRNSFIFSVQSTVSLVSSGIKITWKFIISPTIGEAKRIHYRSSSQQRNLYKCETVCVLPQCAILLMVASTNLMLQRSQCDVFGCIANRNLPLHTHTQTHYNISYLPLYRFRTLLCCLLRIIIIFAILDFRYIFIVFVFWSCADIVRGYNLLVIISH